MTKTPNKYSVALALLLAVSCASCTGGQKDDDGADADVTSRGTIEVTAKLAEIRGELVDRLDYDYAFVMKYDVLAVHRGDVETGTLYVGHYNPHKPRSEAADARVPEIGGNVERFRQGDIHRMALESNIDDHYMGGIINRYFGEETGPIYWAVWTNHGAKP